MLNSIKAVYFRTSCLPISLPIIEISHTALIVSCHLFLFYCAFGIYFVALRLFHEYKSTKQRDPLPFQGVRSPYPAGHMPFAHGGAAKKETVSTETPAPWRSAAMHIQ